MQIPHRGRCPEDVSVPAHPQHTSDSPWQEEKLGVFMGLVWGAGARDMGAHQAEAPGDIPAVPSGTSCRSGLAGTMGSQLA